MSADSQPHGSPTPPLPGELACGWLDLDPHPRLICTTGLALVWANMAAQMALSAGGEIELRDGVLATRERALQADLCRLIKHCGRELATLALPRADSDGHLLLRARRIESEETEEDSAEKADGGHVGLAFLCSSGFRPLYADLDTAFGLTPAEHRVLMRMTEGLTAEAAAEAMELSVETVRSHIRQLYHKIGVASREALFARISPFRL